MPKKKDFFVKEIKEDAGALTYETYYTNIRHKKKQIEEFKKRAAELGDCEESDFLLLHCETLRKKVDEYMELFRGKIEAKKKKIIYVPMDVNNALNYLGYLITESNPDNMHEIRNLINAIQFDTGISKEDKNQISHYKKLINYFKKRVE